MIVTHSSINMVKSKTIIVKGTEISLIAKEERDFISLTDIARYRNQAEPFSIINNWMRSRSTIEFLGLWEKLNNPDFKPLEFDRFRLEAGSNYFVLSPQKWIETTNASGIISRSGRYGGTFAHKDIAFEFASWISSEFKLYLIVEFQRLKDEENDRLKLEWSFQQILSKVNYHIHTDAIKEHLIPPELTNPELQRPVIPFYRHTAYSLNKFEDYYEKIRISSFTKMFQIQGVKRNIPEPGAEVRSNSMYRIV